MSKEEKREETKADLKKRILTKLADYEEIKEDWAEKVQYRSRRIGFKEGIILGLLLGILGNLVVQFFYSVFERVILGNFDIMFWSNLVVGVLALVVILYKFIRYKLELKEDYRKVRSASLEHMRLTWMVTDLKKLLLEEDS